MSRDIELALIDPDPDQPRRQVDTAKVAELAQSLAADSLINPIIVRPIGERYLIVAGERRWRAAQQLRWATIAADVRELDADAARWLQLAENIQRQDLTPIDEAQALKARLNDGMTQAALGARIGKSQSYIAQKLRLLQMPMPLQVLLGRGLLTEGHCRQLLRLEAICHDVIVPLPNPERATRQPNETDHALLCGLLPCLRMEDIPPAYFPLYGLISQLPADSPRLVGLGAAADAWLASIRRLDGQLPYWERVAWWYALWTVGMEASVSTLHQQIDLWQDRFWSTVMWQMEPAPRSKPHWLTQATREDFARIAAPDWEPTPRDAAALESQEWWGRRSDVRHGDIVALLAHPNGRLVLRDAIGHVRAYCLPSNMQPWGQQAREGQALIILENEDEVA